MSLLADELILHIENPNVFTKIWELINKFNKFTGEKLAYIKAGIHKSSAFYSLTELKRKSNGFKLESANISVCR